VRLVETSNKTKSEIARDLGVSDSADAANGAKNLQLMVKRQILWKGHQTSLEEEIKQLKRENEILRQERE
jgi:transposase-like protein